MFLLLSFAASTFVSFADTFPLVRKVSLQEAYEISKDSKELIGVTLTDKDELNEEILDTLNSIAIYYDEIVFCVFDAESNSELNKQYEIEAPAIFLFVKGMLLANYIYPTDDNSFLELCKLIVKPPKTPINNLPELYSSIGSGPYTILAPHKKFELAKILQYRIGNQLGIVDVLSVEKQVLLALGIGADSLALVRKEDMNVVPIEFSVDDVFDASNPVYRNLMASDITEEEPIVFALLCEDFGLEEQDFLFEVGQRFPDYVIGYGNDISDYIQKFNFLPNGDDLHEIIVFNLPKGIYYNVSTYFGKFKGMPFNTENWVNMATRMLNDINEGKLKPSYLTEEIPDPSENDPYVQKVVGKNYEEFVMDPEHDVIMLYKRENCPHCVKFFPQFSSFAKECYDAKLDFLKFGFIDISKNSPSISYPYMAGVPHVHIFPKNNKTDDNPLRGGRDRFALIRMLQAYASEKIPFEAPLPDKSQIALEMVQLMFQAKEMPEEEKVKVFQYIEKMTKILNFTAPNKTKSEEL